MVLLPILVTVSQSSMVVGGEREVVGKFGGVSAEKYERGGCCALRMSRSCGNVDGYMWCKRRRSVR